MRFGYLPVLIALVAALIAPCSATVTSIADAKLAPDGTPVSLSGAIVYAAAPEAFYVEADNRSCGIRVDKMGHDLDGGFRADIEGVVQTDPENDERYIAATTAEGVDTGSVRPIALSNRDLGGADLHSDNPGSGQRGVQGGIGANNIGLLVRTRGRVTYAADDFLYIDDGSRLQDGSGYTGVKIAGNLGLPEGADAVGWYIEVEGISACYKTGNDLRPIVLMMSWSYRNDVTTSSGLTYLDLRKGTGATAEWGTTATVHYTLWLWSTWQIADTSVGGEPFVFGVGSGGAIPGFQEGVHGMKVGGKRFLIVPYNLGYGEEGMPPMIPPYETLLFEVELVGVE